MRYLRNWMHRGLPPVRRKYSRVLVLLSAGLSLLFLVVSCGQIAGAGMDRGSISIDVGAIRAAGTQSADYPEVTTYVFSGTGPGDDSFSIVQSEESATVEQLRTGEWLVSVEGLDEHDNVVLSGESVIDVSNSGQTPLELTLAPVQGIGELSAEVTWNADHTVDPSVRLRIVDSNNEALETVVEEPGAGRVDYTWTDLSTGVYRVLVELYDGETQVSGSVDTLRIVDGRTASFTAQLDPLNKVGLPLEITAEQFILGWDRPQDSTPDSYRVYYRIRGEYAWTILDSIEASDEPQFTVTQEQLVHGTYEFAVSSMTNGEESPLHTSMSDEADPTSGWYIRWLQS